MRTKRLRYSKRANEATLAAPLQINAGLGEAATNEQRSKGAREFEGAARIIVEFPS